MQPTKERNATDLWIVLLKAEPMATPISYGEPSAVIEGRLCGAASAAARRMQTSSKDARDMRACVLEKCKLAIFVVIDPFIISLARPSFVVNSALKHVAA